MVSPISFDSYLRLSACIDDGTAIRWSSETASTQPSAVYDANNNGELDAGIDFFANANHTFTGYFLTINNQQYGVFTNGFAPSVCYVPYNSADGDLAAFLPLTERTTTTEITTSTNSTTNTTSFCFGTGTQIATPDGETAVETLQPGDLIRTLDGRAVPVVWIGHQTVRPAAANLSLPEGRMPVHIAQGALGNHRDLLVSADHGMIQDGCVIHASALVNDTSIRFAQPWEFGQSLTYWHVETARHEGIFANGTPAETFVDAAGRQDFDNYPAYLARFGADRIIPEMRLPRITSARLVPEALRQRLGLSDALAVA